MGKKKRSAVFLAVLGLFLLLATVFSGYLLGKGFIAASFGEPFRVFGISLPLKRDGLWFALLSSERNCLFLFLAVILFCVGIFFFFFLHLRKKARRPLFSDRESSPAAEDDPLDFNPLTSEHQQTKTAVPLNPLVQELSLSLNGRTIQTVPLRPGGFVLVKDGFRITVSLEKTDK